MSDTQEQTITLVPYVIVNGTTYFQVIVTEPDGRTRTLHEKVLTEAEARRILKRQASPLYRDPGETTRGDW